MSTSSVRPGGLHAIFIRSALSAVRVYEQTVTGLGQTQNYIHMVLGEAEKGLGLGRWKDKMDEV